MAMKFNSGGNGQRLGDGEAMVTKMAFDSGGSGWRRQWTMARRW